MVPWRYLAVLSLISILGLGMVIVGPQPVFLHSEFELKEGETAVLVRFRDSVRITLDKIISDNRCPIDVVCITAGQITLQVTLVNSGSVITDNLTGYGVGPYESQPAAQLEIDKFTLYLIDVLPYPTTQLDLHILTAVFQIGIPE